MKTSLTPRDRLARALGLAVAQLSRVTGRGAGVQVGGRVMLALSPALLDHVTRDRTIAAVSATNGKTTTTAFLAAALHTTGSRVVTNASGANLRPGIAYALARDPGAPFASLEVDEAVLARDREVLRPRVVVLGNLSRDQLDRAGEVRALAQKWRAMCEQFDGSVHVVANASDPNVAYAASGAPAVTWFDAGAVWNQDATLCPRCAALLDWDGPRYSCRCGFARPPAAAGVVGDHTIEVAGEKVDVHPQQPGAWNVVNAGLAMTAARELGIAPAASARALEGVSEVGARARRLTLADGRRVELVLAKNPAGWAEVLDYVTSRDCSVVIAINAHGADGRDPSWLWDVPFEQLAGRRVAAAGERMLDIGVRLDYAGVEPVVRRDALAAAAELPGDDLVCAASYTAFYGLMKRAGA